MTYIQVITPNPDVPCTPGWCLQYVRQAYGLPARYSSATEAWDNSTSQHTDWDFPDCWVPVWFSLATEPAGHVALLAPDGSVYSSSDANTSTPHHHPSLDDLISYYAAGNPLTYLGWTEDVASYPVIADSSIGYESATITPLEDTLSAAEVDAIVLESNKQHIETRRIFLEALAAVPGNVLKQPVPYKDPVTGADTGQPTNLATVVGFTDFQHNATRTSIPAAVLNQNLGDGTNANLAGILVAINAKPAAATNVSGASIDVDVLVARLKAELPAAQFEYFKTQITK